MKRILQTLILSSFSYSLVNECSWGVSSQALCTFFSINGFFKFVKAFYVVFFNFIAHLDELFSSFYFYRGDIWACCYFECKKWGPRSFWEGLPSVETLLYWYKVLTSPSYLFFTSFKDEGHWRRYWTIDYSVFKVNTNLPVEFPSLFGSYFLWRIERFLYQQRCI